MSERGKENARSLASEQLCRTLQEPAPFSRTIKEKKKVTSYKDKTLEPDKKVKHTNQINRKHFLKLWEVLLKISIVTYLFHLTCLFLNYFLLWDISWMLKTKLVFCTAFLMTFQILLYYIVFCSLFFCDLWSLNTWAAWCFAKWLLQLWRARLSGESGCFLVGCGAFGPLIKYIFL